MSRNCIIIFSTKVVWSTMVAVQNCSFHYLSEGTFLISVTPPTLCGLCVVRSTLMPLSDRFIVCSDSLWSVILFVTVLPLLPRCFCLEDKSVSLCLLYVRVFASCPYTYTFMKRASTHSGVVVRASCKQSDSSSLLQGLSASPNLHFPPSLSPLYNSEGFSARRMQDGRGD